MKTIIIKTQRELDDLPSSFNEFTEIKIRSDLVIKVTRVIENSQVSAYDSSRVSAYDSSQVSAYNSSRVSAYDSSQVSAYDSSRVSAYELSSLYIQSASCSILEARDNARVVYRVDAEREIALLDKTVSIIKPQDIATPSFDIWLSRGLVVADGIYRRHKSHKEVDDLIIYETDNGFVARKDSAFAHGETESEAISDLKFKLSDRDTSKYKHWTSETEVPVLDMIVAYREITGACSEGTKEFCKSVKLEDRYKVKDVIRITRGKFGNEKFAEFFGELK